jgi:predicted ArsR family transcriptional regulator
MQVLRLLGTVESLTHLEAAQMLEIAPEIARSQLAELESLQFVERAGICESGGSGLPLFRLNKSHPVLALVLGTATR